MLEATPLAVEVVPAKSFVAIQLRMVRVAHSVTNAPVGTIPHASLSQQVQYLPCRNSQSLHGSTQCKETLTKQPRVNKKITHLESKVAGLAISLREHMKVAHGSLKELEVAMSQQAALIKRSSRSRTK